MTIPFRHTRHALSVLAAVCATALAPPLADPAAAAGYQQTNLVTDDQSVLTGLGYAPAASVDPSLVNPWGISYGPTGPFWVSDNGAGLSTLYNGAGTKQGLVVTIAPPTGSPAGTLAAPTGQVFGFGGAAFVFATEDGTISAWSSGTASVLKADNSQIPTSDTGAVYKGLATDGTSLYATNFRAGTLDVFNSSFGAVGSFTDPTTPAGFAPFNVQSLNGTIYVTFAKQNAAKHDDVAGAGNGFVDTFNPTTHAFTRFASQGSLDSPWGLALAPAGFGEFSNALLVGNFGDGRINAFNPVTDQFLGQLTDGSGNPLTEDGLWALTPGNGGNGGDKSKIYFTAGINGESDGLFGSLAPRQAAVPEPGTLALFGLGLLPLAARAGRRRPRS